MKTCLKCTEVHPLSAFNRCARNKDGLQAWCRVCMNANTARWKKANAAKAAASQTSRRGRQLASLVVPFTTEQLAQRLSMARGICYLCREPLTGKNHTDHVLPLDKGGPHCLSNLRPTHALCNLRKGANKPTK